MNLITDPRLVDFQTAKKISNYCNRLGTSEGETIHGKRPQDLLDCEETLYRTKEGGFFLHGYGGAETKYKCITAIGTVFGSNAKFFLTDDEARAWCEEHNKLDVLKKYFSNDKQGVVL